MSDLIVGYDGSECAEKALQTALEIVAPLGDRIVLVFGSAPGGYGGGEIPTHREAVEELAREATEKGRKQAADQGVEVDVELVSMKPAEALLDSAERHDARMIVVGSYSEPPLKGALIGSTPHKLLHLSDVPVLVVPG